MSFSHVSRGTSGFVGTVVHVLWPCIEWPWPSDLSGSLKRYKTRSTIQPDMNKLKPNYMTVMVPLCRVSGKDVFILNNNWVWYFNYPLRIIKGNWWKIRTFLALKASDVAFILQINVKIPTIETFLALKVSVVAVILLINVKCQQLRLLLL